MAVVVIDCDQILIQLKTIQILPYFYFVCVINSQRFKLET